MLPLRVRKLFRRFVFFVQRRFLFRAARKYHQTSPGLALDTILQHLPRIRRIHRSDLCFADRVVVYTQNSRYDLIVVGDGEYMITGGWFDQERLSPQRVRINGCTWGGSMIWKDTVAAPGMCIEFDNRVITSPIRRVLVCRPNAQITPGSQPTL
ncbi:MAG: hypothetical protein AAB354_08530 [candidate division KSB1 bacterium]